MRTAKEMYQFCADHGFGKGFNEKWGLKHFGLIEDALFLDENVNMCFIGLHNYESATKHDNNFAYAVTNKRIICAQKKMIGQTVQTIALDNVNDITFSAGVLLGVITIDTVREIVNVAVDKLTAKNINDSIHEALLKSKSLATEPVASVPADDFADQLMKLKSLVDSGIITQDEFDAKKKQILGI